MESVAPQGNTVTPSAPLAHDEALAYLREAEELGQRVDVLSHADLDNHDVRRALADVRRAYGHALKAADVHASLAIAEEFRALRDDLNAEPAPVGMLTPFGVVRVPEVTP